MPKRKSPISGKRSFDTDDNPIGLTSAFAPVKGPQSVDYDNEDDPVGLTSAFGAITPEELAERPWDDDNKWDGFNWAESLNTDDDDDETDKTDDNDGATSVEEEEFVIVDEDEDDKAERSAKRKQHKSGGSHKDLSLHEARQVEKEEEAEEDIESDSFEEDEFLDDEDAELVEQEEQEEKDAKKSQAKRSKHGAHAAPTADLSPRMKKSRRTRRILIVLVILLILVLGVLGYFVYKTISNSQLEAAQQTQDNTSNPAGAATIDQSSDAIDTMTRLADVPNLAQLLNMTQDEALEAIGHGALVTSNREVNEDGNPIKVSLNITLADEAGSSRTGTPTVYLGLNEAGRVCQAGYSASATSLGFSSLSFVDAVNTEHVIEKTLDKAGVNIAEGSAILPEDKATYTTYANDGTTIVRERCSFDGDVDLNGVPCAWSAVLSYDYTTQIVSGNLNDTVRIIYVYITQK